MIFFVRIGIRNLVNLIRVQQRISKDCLPLNTLFVKRTYHGKIKSSRTANFR